MLSSGVHDVLASMYPMRHELVPCFIGSPGIGKTQGIQQFAEEMGVNMVTFILSCALPSEVSGIRMPDTDTKMLEVFDDSRMAGLKDGDVLFFDEILEAPPALWSAVLTLIQDRTMASGRKLPDVFIVAASNPLSNPGIIPASMRDRFQFIELTWDDEAWAKYIRRRFGLGGTMTSLRQMIHNGLRETNRYGYNVLTPRRVTKYIEWIGSMEDAVERAKAADIIGPLFNRELADTILGLFEDVMDDTIPRAVCDLQDEFGIFSIEEWRDIDVWDITPMKLFQIVEAIEDQDTRESVKAYLGGIEVDQALDNPPTHINDVAGIVNRIAEDIKDKEI